MAATTSDSTGCSAPASGGAPRAASEPFAGRARPDATKAATRPPGTGTSWATGLPRSVMVTTSPAAALATTCEAFCLRARMPTVLMFYIVALRFAERSRKRCASRHVKGLAGRPGRTCGGAASGKQADGRRMRPGQRPNRLFGTHKSSTRRRDGPSSPTAWTGPSSARTSPAGTAPPCWTASSPSAGSCASPAGSSPSPTPDELGSPSGSGSTPSAEHRPLVPFLVRPPPRQFERNVPSL